MGKDSEQHAPSADASAPQAHAESPQRRTLAVLGVLLLALLSATVWLSLPQHPMNASAVVSDARLPSSGEESGEPIAPLPADEAVDWEKAALGRRLFNEPLLSGDGSISCASCHDLKAGGADGRAVARGVGGADGDVNTLSVLNSIYNPVLFWDGRATSLETQLDGPIQHAREMGSSWDQIVAKLSAHGDYPGAFARQYPDGITVANIKNALVSFERTLTTPNARFDRYLRGAQDAISADEKRGYQLFKGYGCIACHQGRNVGGNMFQVVGVMADYFADRGSPTRADLGRYNVTGNEEDRHRFRVPSLRNVAQTAPYFHDGSVPTLDQAVRLMAKYQLGRPMPEEDVALIVAFLGTLSGEYQDRVP